MKHILVIGQNPARASKTGEPFVGTQSGKRLLRILQSSGIKRFDVSNVCDEITEDNRPLTRDRLTVLASTLKFYMKVTSYDGIIAVGTQAAFALEKCLEKRIHYVPCLHIPHTSGKNRFWNRKDAENSIVNTIATWYLELEKTE